QRVVLTRLLAATFAVLVSAAASTLFRATAAATTASYAVLLSVCVGPLVIWLGRGAPSGPRAADTVLMFSPVAAALNAADFPGFTEYTLLPANWWIVGIASLGLFALVMIRTWQLCRPE